MPEFAYQPNAYEKLEKCIFDVQFPGNWFEFGFIGNVFYALQSEALNKSYSDSIFIRWVQKS